MNCPRGARKPTTKNDDDDTRVFRFANKPLVTGNIRFFEHNRKIREKIENWQTRVRRHDLGDLDGKMFEFYAQRIPKRSVRSRVE
jgi:hypothetical protein